MDPKQLEDKIKEYDKYERKIKNVPKTLLISLGLLASTFVIDEYNKHLAYLTSLGSGWFLFDTLWYGLDYIGYLRSEDKKRYVKEAADGWERYNNMFLEETKEIIKNIKASWRK